MSEKKFFFCMFHTRPESSKMIKCFLFYNEEKDKNFPIKVYKVT